VSGITDALVEAIGSAGVYAIFWLMFLDAVFPAGSEIVMLYAGALAAGAFPEHQVSLFGTEIESTGWAFFVVSMAGVLGYWLGSLMGWAIGRYGGRPLVERYGRYLHLGPEKLDRAHAWFEGRGEYAVFITRNLPVVRSFISIPAGVAEMRFVPYAWLSLLGSLPWTFGFAAAGLVLGASWEQVHDRFRWADYVLVGLIVAAAAFLGARWWFRRTRARAVETSAEDTA
jgi:membrane protein DedA with SNARE-associated domain